MELDTHGVLQILRRAGVTDLFHANSVKTSCTFLAQAKLLSRGTVSELGLPQTGQQTDSLDQDLGLWYDIFVDGVDIHRRGNRRNNYGPVLFRLDLSLLEQNWVSHVWVTKSNPQYWTLQTPHEDRFYQTLEELEAEYSYGDFHKMVVLRSIGGVVRLRDFLIDIKLDDPNRVLNGIKLYDYAFGALKMAAIAGEIDEPTVIKRACIDACGCKDVYSTMSVQTLTKFFKV